MLFQQQGRRRAPTTTRTLLVVLFFCVLAASVSSASNTCDALLSSTTTATTSGACSSSTLLTSSLLFNKKKNRACRHDWPGSATSANTALLLRLRGGGGGDTSSSLHLSADALRLAETLAPKIGIVTSSALYFSPAMAVLHAMQVNDIGNLNPLPLAIMSFTSVSWLVYGLSARDVYVTLSNIAGAVASIGYVVGTLPLLNGDDIKQRRQLRMTQGIVMAGTAAVLGLWTTLGIVSASASNTSSSFNNMAQVTSSLGMFASVISIILSASPLFTIRQVVSTRNSSSILGPLTMAQVINALLWSMYGLAIRNAFVYGPNLIGLGLGLAQLALKIAFPSSSSKQ